MASPQARGKAVQHLRWVAQHSRLEDQEVGDDDTAAQIEELADQFENRRDLWSNAQR